MKLLDSWLEPYHIFCAALLSDLLPKLAPGYRFQLCEQQEKLPNNWIACVDVQDNTARILLDPRMRKLFERGEYPEVARILLHEMAHVVLWDLSEPSTKEHIDTVERVTERLAGVLYRALPEWFAHKIATEAYRASEKLKQKGEASIDVKLQRAKHSPTLEARAALGTMEAGGSRRKADQGARRAKRR
jgi:hypothetical protein